MATLYVRNLNEKVSVNTLKKKLDELFSPYGNVLAITAHKNLKMKGQAFVAYAKQENAIDAVQSLQGTMLFDKQLEIQDATSQSDAVLKETLGKTEFEDYLKKRKVEKEQKNRKRASSDEEPKQKTKRIKIVINNEPNKLLLLQKVDPELTSADIKSIFDKFQGLKEINLVKPRNLALIEFTEESAAVICKEALGQTIQIKNHECYLTYAKK
ncbi:hypothetical protein PP7435_CHR3-0537 [Komagataella phaffii CBS 7435]|uniref:RRM domain-containing protein n=2 Tax=Komagataella phaffii TaxID=460519 RepID=C4R574_KOMPG|nr:Hypothetical protein PAS_chr3_0663 [Komagataella phaffii GS115]AOA63784.1 GQ67_03749T0 [Komagataella phaffii]CAH2449513.1 Hypothetical protein BQ9382_C3-2870 [Komagataella phaffii CBS 7435]AOA68855.1 GQ68_03721T0 [Komagataella phaffii GS115]CAY70710.1 Hypothetical protein PAS_chr3_0663 [Komagataella phaffii GS115]CCA39496.1 hypothetical protein PP7435_CHR3-0537 [Komagataella phaffii CBS 7435]